MPWNLKAICLSGLACLISGGPSSAQVLDPDAQPRTAQQRAGAATGALAVGGYSRTGVDGRTVVEFYTVIDRASSRDGVRFTSIPMARRWLERADERLDQGWVDGRACDALYGVLTEFTRLAPPVFHTPPLLGPPRSGPVGIGGPDTRIPPVVSTVWGIARQADNAPMTMTITGTDGLIDRWTDFAERSLAGCWTHNAPDFGGAPSPAAQ